LVPTGVSAIVEAELIAVRDRLAVQLDDDVVALQTGLLGGRALDDVLHDDALQARQTEALGDLRRHVGDVHAHHGALDRAGGDELLGDVAREIDGHREADALRVRVDRRVDADDLAADVAQRTTRVAEVDAGVGLDKVLVVGRATEDVEVGATHRAHDADRDRAAQIAERIADGDRPVTDAELVRVAERQHRQVATLDLDHGHVGGRVGADDGGLELAAVVERDLDVIGVLDDMVVRQDATARVEDEAQAGRRHALLARRTLPEEATHHLLRRIVAVLVADLLGHIDEHDGRQRLADETHERALGQGRRRGGNDATWASAARVTRRQAEARADAEAEHEPDGDEDGGTDEVMARAVTANRSSGSSSVTTVDVSPCHRQLGTA
jgi:hypothetical protein